MIGKQSSSFNRDEAVLKEQCRNPPIWPHADMPPTPPPAGRGPHPLCLHGRADPRPPPAEVHRHGRRVRPRSCPARPGDHRPHPPARRASCHPPDGLDRRSPIARRRAQPAQPGPAAPAVHRRLARVGDRRTQMARPAAAYRRRSGDSVRQGWQRHAGCCCPRRSGARCCASASSTPASTHPYSHHGAAPVTCIPHRSSASSGRLPSAPASN